MRRKPEYGAPVGACPGQLMNPQVEAAVIAGIVSLISLGGTVVVAVRGLHSTRQATAEMTESNRQTTDANIKAQREQLDKTLEEQHVRTLNERFATAVDMLGNDKPAAVRLAGVYAIAGLADDWKDGRQTCVDVLCGYLRMPYTLDPGDGEARLSFLADREVRDTIIKVIATHLRHGVRFSWHDRDSDFTGILFENGGDFSGAVFSGRKVTFDKGRLLRREDQLRRRPVHQRRDQLHRSQVH